MNTPITITAIWLRNIDRHNLEVLVEIDGKWRRAIHDSFGPEESVSHIAEGNGAYQWPVVDKQCSRCAGVGLRRMSGVEGPAGDYPCEECGGTGMIKEENP